MISSGRLVKSDNYSDSTRYVKSEHAVNRLAAVTYDSAIAK